MYASNKRSLETLNGVIIFENYQSIKRISVIFKDSSVITVEM